MPQKRSPGLQALAYLVLAVACIITLVPVFYIVSTAFKQTNSLFHYPPQWLPRPVYWGNFTALFTSHSFLRWMWNSLFVATSVTGLKLVMDSLAAYAFAKLDFPGRDRLFITVIATLMIPFAAQLIPLYLLVKNLGLLNTYWALILPPLANPIGIFLLRQFMKELPADLDNAARIDGCTEFQIYRHMILPLCRPPLVVLGVFLFMNQWTSFLWPLVATTEDHMRVLTVGVQSMKAIFTVDWGLISMGSLLTMVPITLVFILLQRYFVASPLTGALKE